MAELSTNCPLCDRKLKLPSLKAVGKKAKCPGCKQTIVIPAPKAAAKPKPKADEIPWGLEARWIPEVSATAAIAEPSLEPPALATAATEDASDFDFNADHSAVDEAPFDVAAVADSPGRGATSSADLSITALAKKRKQKKLVSQIITGLALLVIVGGGLAYVVQTKDAADTKQSVAKAKPTDKPTRPITRPVSTVRIESPTKGDPFDAILMPDGVSVMIHTRPSELWSSGLLRSVPASVVATAESWITTQSGYAPPELAELTVGIVLGGRGSEPQLAGVARLHQAYELGPLLQRLGGDVRSIGDQQRVVTTGDRVVITKDDRTIAFGPAALATEMETAMDRPNGFVNSAIVDVLPRTDRTRLLSFVGSENDLSIHAEALLGADGASLLAAAIELFAADFVGFDASLHHGQETYIEVVGKPIANSTASVARTELQSRWDALPNDLLQRLRGTQPVGAVREFVGRVPAMAEAARLCSRIDTANGLVRLQVSLPPSAASNLLLGTVVGYNVLSADPAATLIAAAPTKSESLADRLGRNVDARFERLPLQDVLKYLGDEADAETVIDGNAIKLEGNTKNEPQTFDLGTTSIRSVFAEMAKRYPNFAFIFNETENKIITTTKNAATEQGLTPATF